MAMLNNQMVYIYVMYIIYLVGGTPTPLKNINVKWDDYSQYTEIIFVGWGGKKDIQQKMPIMDDDNRSYTQKIAIS